MSINLQKNKSSLQEAWKDVLNEKTDTNWALFGYEGQSYDLKVISTGKDGMEEMIEDLNSGKIMYAFVKIIDPLTSLNKFVLINWQGEGANTVRKGICANHLRDIERFFTGAQLTITARNEEEVEPQLIIDKVAKAGSTTYNFKSRAETIEPTGPVGTSYQRINPIKEINSAERDQFWKKEQEERSLIEERKRQELEQERLKQKEIIRNVEDNDFENDKSNDVNNLKQQRNQEAQQLISQRTINAKSIFENNGTQPLNHTSKKAPEKPVRSSLLKAQQQQNTENVSKAEDLKKTLNSIQDEQSSKNVAINEESDDDSNQFSTIKRCPKDADKKEEKQDNSSEQPAQKTNLPDICNQITTDQFMDEYIYNINNPGLQARALYDYQAADDTEISFDPGDIITNIDQVDEGWWQGLAPDGITYGLFPANYVELLS